MDFYVIFRNEMNKVLNLITRSLCFMRVLSARDETYSIRIIYWLLTKRIGVACKKNES